MTIYSNQQLSDQQFVDNLVISMPSLSSLLTLGRNVYEDSKE